MLRRPKPPSPTWRAVLRSHVKDLVAIGFLVVPTVRFGVLVMLIVLAHHRRRALESSATGNPTAERTGQQTINAFPWDEASRHLLRGRDGAYGEAFRSGVWRVGIEQAIIAAPSPWQDAYAERLIGSIRRECLNHVIVLNEEHLKRVLRKHFSHNHHWRTHPSLELDCPQPRMEQSAEEGAIAEVAEVGSLHHHHERRAAQGDSEAVVPPGLRSDGCLELARRVG